MASRRDRAVLRRLPTTFRYSRARQLLTERQLRDLLEHGVIVRVARGVYRKTAADQGHELIEVVIVRPRATLCLQSALVYHGLLEQNPARHTIALPRGTRRLDTTVPVAWHQFDRDTFDLGRATIRLDATTRIGIYSAERSIIDAYRLREHEGHDLCHAALRAWLRRGGQPSRLLGLATRFGKPKGMTALRQALEVLQEHG
jgi:predicted transcriptional regulator of viral defense system